MEKGKIILSIESAIRSGSVSIYENDREVDFWVGTSAVSRAEDLLEVITSLLHKNEMVKEDIDLIAVSNFVGSYTGIRIGLSTALGIKKAIFCKVTDMSILQAIAYSQTGTGKIITAVSNNNRDALSQQFESGASIANAKVENRTIEQFYQYIINMAPLNVYVNHDLFNVLCEISLQKNFELKNINNTGKNLAKYIGNANVTRLASDNEFS